MAGDASVTTWIKGLKQGDREAAEQLWVRYFDKLVAAAEKRLRSAQKRAYDEEDVALSVFESLCQGAERGNFKQLSTRDDLWALLLALTHKKSVDRIRHETRVKRGGGRVRGESVFAQRGNGFGAHRLRDLVSQAPTPELIALLREQHQDLMDSLPNETLRQVARLRLEGYSVKEIATEFEYTTRWAERKLQLIREIWGAKLAR